MNRTDYAAPRELVLITRVWTTTGLRMNRMAIKTAQSFAVVKDVRRDSSGNALGPICGYAEP